MQMCEPFWEFCRERATQTVTPSRAKRTVRGRALGPSACLQKLFAFPSAPPLAWPRALTRMIIARSHAQRRDWRQPRSAKQLHWARPRQAFALGAHAREPTQWPHACDRCRATHRALPACTPSYAVYILRLQDTKPEPRDHAAPSDRRITTRRRLAGGVRQTRGQRPSVRGAISTPIRGAISARVPPSSPSRTQDQHKSPATHSTPRAQHPNAPIAIHAPRH